MNGLFVLAIADGWVIGMWVANLLLTLCGGGWVVFLVNRRTRRIETIEAELQQTARQLVSAEITLQTQSLQAAINNLTKQMETINQRVADGEKEGEKLDKRGQTLELALRDQTNEIQKWLLEHFATKNDVTLVSDRLSALGDRVGELGRDLARHEGAADATRGKGARAN